MNTNEIIANAIFEHDNKIDRTAYELADIALKALSDAGLVVVPRAAVLDMAQDVMAYADEEWKSRAEYPHQQQRYERDTETAQEMIKAHEDG